MEIQITILSGPRSGEVCAFTYAADESPRDLPAGSPPDSPIPASTVSFGRLPGNTLVFNSDSDSIVSGRHAEIHLGQSSCTVADLNSSNGTYVNGLRINGIAILKNGDKIQLGRKGPELLVKTPGGKSDLEKTVMEGTLFASTGDTMVGKRTVNVMIKQMFEEEQKAKRNALGETSVLLRDTVNKIVSKSSRKVQVVLLTLTIIIIAISGLLYFEYQRLQQERQESLATFQKVAQDNAESIFMVCGYDQATKEYIPIGTGFVVREKGVLLTNAHVAVALDSLRVQQDHKYRGVAIQNGHAENVFFISRVIIHPKYNPDADFSPDMACLVIDAKGKRLNAVEFATTEDYPSVEKGYEVAVLGFPGITMDPENPEATLSCGKVGRMINKTFIQHDCQTSGGDSGSPLFNKQGRVVGIHFGGRGNILVLVPEEVKDAKGKVTQKLVSRRIKEAVGINEGIRADVIQEFLTTAFRAAQ
jgi:pSer/pThr/pTyr-binding forkhead associated (FHA) protein/V8-like Glu-specific endopeptidase